MYQTIYNFVDKFRSNLASCKSELLRAPLQTSTLGNINDIRGQTLAASEMFYFSKKKLNFNFPKSLFTYIMLHLTYKKVIMLVN